MLKFIILILSISLTASAVNVDKCHPDKKFTEFYHKNQEEFAINSEKLLAQFAKRNFITIKCAYRMASVLADETVRNFDKNLKLDKCSCFVNSNSAEDDFILSIYPILKILPENDISLMQKKLQAECNSKFPQEIENEYGGVTFLEVFPYFADEEKLLSDLKAEDVEFDWIKIYEEQKMVLPSHLVRIREIKKLRPDSKFLFLRSSENIAALKQLKESGVEVFLNFRRESYDGLTLGSSDSDHAAISRALKINNNKPYIIITLTTTTDAILHESVHADQMMKGNTREALKRLNSLYDKHKLAEKDLTVLNGIYSAILEAPAYSRQQDFLENSPHLKDQSSTEAFVDNRGNLVTLPAVKYREKKLEEFSKRLEVVSQFNYTNSLIGEYKKKFPKFSHDLCEEIDRSFISSELFNKKNLFSNCYAQ